MKFNESYFADHMRPLTGSAIREIFKLLAKPGMISFAGGNPSMSALEPGVISDIAREVLAKHGATLLQYGATDGFAPLRESAAEFLRRVNEGRPYTAKERAAAAELVGKLKHSLASKALKSERTFVNPLEKFFFNRAREVFGWKLFERSEYYLGLAAEAARAGEMDNFKVKVTPCIFKGHPAICLDNGTHRQPLLLTAALQSEVHSELT